MKKAESAIEKILSDHFHVSPDRAQNQPIYDFGFDYAALLGERDAANEDWRKLPAGDKARYERGLPDFLQERGVENPKDLQYSRAKNAHLVRQEVSARISEPPFLKALPLGRIDYQSSLAELAESVENVEQIKSLYRLRKITSGSTKNAGISSDEAVKLKNCFSQGRELYFAGCGGSLMVKPLNHFYSATAYSYGMIVLNNPIRYSKDNLPSSHGMIYLPDVIQCQFGGDSPSGTFSELFCSFPTQLIRNNNIEFTQDCTSSIQAFQTHRINVSIGTLLSMLPEMSNYYSLMTGRRSRAFPMEVVNANNPRMLTWEFQIGDGTSLPTRDIVERSFAGFEINERFGKYIVSVPAVRASEIRALIYSDISGRLSFIENPFFPVLLPEICTHFLLNHIYSCIMRYRPDDWGNVILNEVSTDTSLLTRHYFANFERKFLLLVLRCLSRYTPTVSLGDAV
ncbi:YaaC family protein [Pararhodobacter sp.]|uniref:YaaC family protein n=1 Tax=Pararhodobacter sp. TaxID=2127056 RepID=UPI002AFF50D5|nr:YaaC family protein [Pararhodobacter sp.]